MKTPDFEHGIVYFKQFGAERVKKLSAIEASESVYVRESVKKSINLEKK